MKQQFSKPPIPQNKGIAGKKTNNISGRIATWKDLKYGMFIHWGLYSEFAGVVNGEPVKKGYSEQIQMWANIAETDYLQAAKYFTGDKFDPDAICKLAKEAEMNYIVITSKHHDGFCMFDTKTTDYNVVQQTPYGQDPLKALSDACKNHGLKFGVYFSLVDWHQGHVFDEDNNNLIPASMEPVIVQQLRELMTNYGPIAEVWFDMGRPTPLQSEKFKRIVIDLQPNAAVNSRIWNNQGDFRTLADNQIPAYTLDNPWQTPASIYLETWGYRKWQVREDLTGKVKNLVRGLTSVRARGGNYLLNIGPRGDGSIVSFEKQVLQEIGNWLKQHRQSVLNADGTRFGGQSWGEVTAFQNRLYLHVMDIPTSGEITLQGLTSRVENVRIDGKNSTLAWSHEDNSLKITIPEQIDDIMPFVIHVDLAEALQLIPEDTVEWDGEQTLTINKGHLDTGYGFSDGGYYTTLRQTVIRQTVYFTSKKDANIICRLRGQIHLHEAAYVVAVNDEKQIFTGTQLLENEIGTFFVKADELNILSIILAEPAFKEQDLQMTLDAIEIAVAQ